MDFEGIMPRIDEQVFIAPTAAIIGQVSIGRDSSVWFGAVIRGDEASISIGKGSNIQDNAVLHCDSASPMSIGDNVTVGHGAIVHGATVGSNVLIGMGAVVLNGAVIGDDCIIAAGAVVKENAVVPAGTMMVGVPARAVRQLDESAVRTLRSTSHYVPLSKKYMEK